MSVFFKMNGHMITESYSGHFILHCNPDNGPRHDKTCLRGQVPTK